MWGSQVERVGVPGGACGEALETPSLWTGTRSRRARGEAVGCGVAAHLLSRSVEPICTVENSGWAQSVQTRRRHRLTDTHWTEDGTARAPGVSLLVWG